MADAVPEGTPDLDRPAPPLTWRDVLDRIVPPDRVARLRLVAVVVVVALAGAGAWWLLRTPPAPATELTLPYAPGAGGIAAGAPTTTAPAAALEVVVHAAGAVASPGIYRLPATARVADLLDAAGGPTPEADLDRVNLAAALADGQRVWFPRVGEESPPVVPDEGGRAPPGPGTGDGARVDLNTASVADLERLPGVGPSIAAAIVEHRERSGPFRSVEDLLDVRGIGPARLEQLRELVTV